MIDLIPSVDTNEALPSRYKFTVETEECEAGIVRRGLLLTTFFDSPFGNICRVRFRKRVTFEEAWKMLWRDIEGP